MRRGQLVPPWPAPADSPPEPPPLPAREGADIGVVRRAAQRFHRHIHLAVQIPEVLAVDDVLKFRHLLRRLVGVVHGKFVVTVEDGLFGLHPLHHVAADVQLLVELGLLREIADACALGGPCLTGEVLVDPGHDAQQRGFPRAVHADHADLDPREEVQADILEDLLATRIGLGDAIHVIHILV